MFAATSKNVFQATGHKTSKSSYGNTSQHTAMTTAFTQSNMSTMMLRKMAADAARKVRQDYDPQTEIQKYIPRQPQRLNEVSYRFYLGERKNSNQS